jgi:hypothetical protein
LAQRYLYGRAKRWRGVQVACTVFLPALLAVIVPTGLRAWVALSALLLVALDEVFLEPAISDSQKKAASVQEGFDTEVFELEWPAWRAARPAPETVCAGVRDAERASRSIEVEQLEDWYPRAIGRVPHPLSVLVCQRFNIVYGLTLRTNVVRVLTAVLLIALAVPLLIAQASGWSIATLLIEGVLPALPIIRWAWRELNRHKKHAASQERLQQTIERVARDAARGALAESEVRLWLRRLQDEVFGLRTTDVPIFDWVYWLLRKRAEPTLNAAAEAYVDELRALLPR